MTEVEGVEEKGSTFDEAKGTEEVCPSIVHLHNILTSKLATSLSNQSRTAAKEIQRPTKYLPDRKVLSQTGQQEKLYMAGGRLL